MNHDEKGHALRLAPGDRVVVTGGAGFIGTHLVDRLLALGAHVHVLDRAIPADLGASLVFNSGLTIEHADIGGAEDARRLDRAISRARMVFLLASRMGVAYAHRHRLATTDAIMRGGIDVVRACQRHRCPLLFTSSSEVYGDAGTRPMRESDPLRLGIQPRRGYAAAKLAVEHLVMGLSQEAGVQTWTVRLFNIAGARQRPEAGHVVSALSKAAVTGKPMVIHGDGLQQRTFLHVADAVDALLAVTREETLVGRVVNLGGDQPVALNGLSHLVQRVAGRQVPVLHVPVEDAFGANFVAVS